jgi:hypothetical protein
MKVFLQLALVSFLMLGAALGQTTTSITQRGITFTFSEAREFGQFVNGEYWVQGPVTVTAMTPEWDPAILRNGWMVNPVPFGKQAFSGPPSAGYDETLRPPLPISLTSGSLIKSIGVPTAKPDEQSLTTAVVLTVLPDIPPGRGVNYFRPPYNGSSKPLIPTSSAQLDLLPTLALTADSPSLATIQSNFSKGLRLDHFIRSRAVRPADAFGPETYHPRLAKPMYEAIVRLMGPETAEVKKPALFAVGQHAIDKAYAVYLGFRSTLSDGHDPFHRTFALWGVVMFNLTEMTGYMQTATGFHEDQFLYRGINAVLWGEETGYAERTYWARNDNTDLSTSKGIGDPYKFIDGGKYDKILISGELIESGYQRETAHAIKGAAFIARMMPQVKNLWPAARWELANEYAQRWVDVGYWFAPDPVARHDEDPANYGITYGPNGSGSYIAGAGRNPSRHATEPDAARLPSLFLRSMWNAYANTSAPGDTTPPTLSSLVIDVTGTTLTLNFSETVVNVNQAHYTLTGGPSLSAPTVAGATVTFTLTPPMESGVSPVLGYTSGSGRTADAAGNLLATITSRAVTNNSLSTGSVPPRPGSRNKGTGRRGAFSQ